MKSTNGQHEGNELLRQLIDISQNTLEAQNMQLEVLLRFDRNMNVLADRIERTNEVLGERILQTNQTVQILGDKLDQTNQTVHVLSDNMNRLVDISERNFKQSEGNFSLIAHQFGVMNDKLDQVIDLEVWVRSIEADMKEIKRKVG
jgi:ABC-type transporter Mla subunit MlaD